MSDKIETVNLVRAEINPTWNRLTFPDGTQVYISLQSGQLTINVQAGRNVKMRGMCVQEPNDQSCNITLQVPKEIPKDVKNDS